MPRLWLSASADAVIRTEARHRRFVETGGPLFGYTDASSRDAVVAIAYGPGPKARHRPRSLTPDPDATDAAIREVHARSRGSFSYIGEWHTHPGGAARPTRRDVDALAAIADELAVDLPAPIAIIVPTAIMRRRIRVRDPGAFRWIPVVGAVQRLDVNLTEDVELFTRGVARS
jgi:integrative and conjugative element protein (TIGR02256 family)